MRTARSRSSIVRTKAARELRNGGSDPFQPSRLAKPAVRRREILGFVGEPDGKTKYHNKVVHEIKKDAQKYAREAETKRDLEEFWTSRPTKTQRSINSWTDGLLNSRRAASKSAHLGAINISPISTSVPTSAKTDCLN